MMVPSQRLLLLAAVVALPLATAAGFVPGIAVPCGITLGLWALVAAADAIIGRTVALKTLKAGVRMQGQGYLLGL